MPVKQADPQTSARVIATVNVAAMPIEDIPEFYRALVELTRKYTGATFSVNQLPPLPTRL